MEDYRQMILRWTSARMPFSLIEDQINAMDELSDEQQSALWLYSYGLLSRQRRLNEAHASMEIAFDEPRGRAARTILSA
jgi:hypothetical protein